ncbi:MAG: FAD-dependent oxidoreductase [Nanoarchaeota archaeon]|nr:FAD-dependent oxidoreductase [Nanoarchaeota archaeon]
MEKDKIYDLLILGAGPAGLTAAIYGGRYNLKTLVIARSIGGMANDAGELENWPGYFGSGLELMLKFKKQAEEFGAEFLQTEIKDVKKEENGFVIYADDKEIRGKTLIVTLGTKHRKLDVPGEKEFLGKGVSYCATCDGSFFRNKTVSVIGGSDSAAKAAIYLSKICKMVYVIYRGKEMRCEPIYLSKIYETKNIEIFHFSKPLEILGKKKVEEIKFLQETPGEKSAVKTLSLDGVFIEIGTVPANEVVKNLGLEMVEDYIKTDKEMQTNIDGVFAAGDVTNNKFKQVVTAAAEGAIAAKSAHEWLIGE